MAEPLKFKFDTFFGTPHPKADKALVAPNYSEQELQQAKKEAFDEGLAQGRSETMNSVEQQIAESLSKLAEKADDLDVLQKGEFERIRGEAAELAHEIASKLAPALTARMPLSEIRVLLEECLSHLNETPHIVVRVATELADSMREQADELAEERGFSGKIMIMSEPDMAPGDCRIEWADGGIERNADSLREKIGRAIQRHVDAMMKTGSPQEGKAMHAPVPEHLNSEGIVS